MADDIGWANYPDRIMSTPWLTLMEVMHSWEMSQGEWRKCSDRIILKLSKSYSNEEISGIWDSKVGVEFMGQRRLQVKDDIYLHYLLCVKRGWPNPRELSDSIRDAHGIELPDPTESRLSPRGFLEAYGDLVERDPTMGIHTSMSMGTRMMRYLAMVLNYFNFDAKELLFDSINRCYHWTLSTFCRVAYRHTLNPQLHLQMSVEDSLEQSISLMECILPRLSSIELSDKRNNDLYQILFSSFLLPGEFQAYKSAFPLFESGPILIYEKYSIAKRKKMLVRCKGQGVHGILKRTREIMSPEVSPSERPTTEEMAFILCIICIYIIDDQMTKMQSDKTFITDNFVIGPTQKLLEPGKIVLVGRRIYVVRRTNEVRYCMNSAKLMVRFLMECNDLISDKLRNTLEMFRGALT